jgi:hypothetical protein
MLVFAFVFSELDQSRGAQCGADCGRAQTGAGPPGTRSRPPTGADHGWSKDPLAHCFSIVCRVNGDHQDYVLCSAQAVILAHRCGWPVCSTVHRASSSITFADYSLSRGCLIALLLLQPGPALTWFPCVCLFAKVMWRHEAPAPPAACACMQAFAPFPARPSRPLAGGVRLARKVCGTASCLRHCIYCKLEFVCPPVLAC